MLRKVFGKFSGRALVVVALISVAVVALDYLILPSEILGLEAGWRSLVFAFVLALSSAFREERRRD
jgi:hypothetical protein